MDNNEMTLILTLIDKLETSTYRVGELEGQQIKDDHAPHASNPKTQTILQAVKAFFEVCPPVNAKIAAIKLVRNLTGLGLKECKEFVEGIQTPQLPNSPPADF